MSIERTPAELEAREIVRRLRVERGAIALTLASMTSGIFLASRASRLPGTAVLDLSWVPLASRIAASARTAASISSHNPRTNERE